METEKNLGYATWLDRYGWMESMKGSKWNEVIKKNQKAFEAAVKPVEPLALEIQAEFATAISYVDPIKIHDVHVQMTGTLRFEWKWADDDTTHVCADLDVEPHKHIWTVEDNSSGGEVYKVSYRHGDKKVWSLRTPVGPFVAILGDRCYVLEAQKSLWYRNLVSFNKRTGKDRKLHLRMVDHRFNLALVKAQNGSLFCVANNAGQQRLWHIKESGVIEELTGPYESFVVVGAAERGGKPCFFGRPNGMTVFEPVGTALHKEKFPNLAEHIPQWFSFSEHLLCTRRYGLRSLWDTKTGKRLYTIVGDYEYNDLFAWRTGGLSVTVARPGFDRVILGNDSLCAYADSDYRKATSRDGTRVPFILVQSCNAPTGLLCVAYGAYGVPTHLDVSRWKPLLRRGWVVCLCLVRGGGDHNDAWAEAARRNNKVKSVEDLEACIRKAQHITHIGARNTAIYGRSAGGYLVGAALTRNNTGSLFSAVYAEVPYVDILATTANPELPLTELEYNEFGDPMRRLANLEAILNISPIHALPKEGAPRIFVLCRTGLQDKEVFAYEPVKWLSALQDAQEGVSGAEPKLLAITADEGHFVGGNSAFAERAQDLAILVDWNKKSNVRIYKMANTRRNRRSTRKNNVARKNNAVTMGGKRKGRKGTRKASKGRKGSRKH